MDDALLHTLNDLTGSRLVDGVVVLLAKGAIAVVFLVVALLVVRALRPGGRGPAPVVGVAVTLGTAFVLGLLAAALHPERRPFETLRVHQLITHAPGQSFPSDHATAAFACALAVLVLLSRRVGLALLGLALLIGLARVTAGIHHPVDVLGSLAVALLAVPGGLLARDLAARRWPSREPVGAAHRR